MIASPFTFITVRWGLKRRRGGSFLGPGAADEDDCSGGGAGDHHYTDGDYDQADENNRIGTRPHNSYPPPNPPVITSATLFLYDSAQEVKEIFYSSRPLR